MRFVKKLTANSFVEQETLILIYNAIARPYYCCEVWSLFCEAQSKDCKNCKIEQLELL